jgi:hypothetical protein
MLRKAAPAVVVDLVCLARIVFGPISAIFFVFCREILTMIKAALKPDWRHATAPQLAKDQGVAVQKRATRAAVKFTRSPAPKKRVRTSAKQFV